MRPEEQSFPFKIIFIASKGEISARLPQHRVRRAPDAQRERRAVRGPQVLQQVWSFNYIKYVYECVELSFTETMVHS